MGLQGLFRNSLIRFRKPCPVNDGRQGIVIICKVQEPHEPGLHLEGIGQISSGSSECQLKRAGLSPESRAGFPRLHPALPSANLREARPARRLGKGRTAVREPRRKGKASAQAELFRLTHDTEISVPWNLSANVAGWFSQFRRLCHLHGSYQHLVELDTALRGSVRNFSRCHGKPSSCLAVPISPIQARSATARRTVINDPFCPSGRSG